MELLNYIGTDIEEVGFNNNFLFIFSEGKIIHNAYACKTEWGYDIYSMPSPYSVDGKISIPPYTKASVIIDKLIKEENLRTYFCQIGVNIVKTVTLAAKEYAKINDLKVLMTVTERPQELQPVIDLVKYYNIENVYKDRFDSTLIMEPKNAEAIKTILGMLSIPCYDIDV